MVKDKHCVQTSGGRAGGVAAKTEVAALAKIRSWQILTAGSAALFAAEWGLTNIVVKPRQQLDNREACKKELALAGLTLAD